ncbi:MAG: hypothetical protein ABI273_14925, partial [Lacunisphaera sp.]
LAFDFVAAPIMVHEAKAKYSDWHNFQLVRPLAANMLVSGSKTGWNPFGSENGSQIKSVAVISESLFRSVPATRTLRERNLLDGN